MTRTMLMKTQRFIKSILTMLQLLVLLLTMSLSMSSHAQTGNLTITRTPSTMIAGQAFTIVWSSTEPSAVATKYSCVSPAGGFAGSATLSVSGSASGTADPNWLWKDSTCAWTVVDAVGNILASRTDIMKTVAAPVNGVTYIHTDGLGSPVAKSDANGNLIAGSRTRYEPYGMAVAGTATPTIGFTGHVNDADTGLTYMQQRYYDPVAGRFLSEDPVLTDANSGNSFNRYVYASNNPYKYVDPDGRQERAAEGFSAAMARDPRSMEAFGPASAVITGLMVVVPVVAIIAPSATAITGTSVTTGNVIASKVESTTAKSVEQVKNIDRFVKKLPANAKDSVVTKPLPNGGVAAQATSPGRVPGSSAVYEKQIDSAGKTIQYTKTTNDPAGNIVHVKDKITGEVFK